MALNEGDMAITTKHGCMSALGAALDAAGTAHEAWADLFALWDRRLK